MIDAGKWLIHYVCACRDKPILGKLLIIAMAAK